MTETRTHRRKRHRDRRRRYVYERGRIETTLAAALDARGMTQADLSRRSGILQPYVNALVAGRHRPRPSTAVRICRVLAMTYSELWPTADAKAAD